MDQQHVLARQRELYGEPLGSRFDRVRRAFGISQARLAAVIGLSAPMLSQLASGQRAKISNPSVYARLLRLEQHAAAAREAPDAAGRERLQRALEEVQASQPTLTAEIPGSQAELVVRHLAELAPAAQLRLAADASSGALHEVLADAAARAADRDTQ